jgi:hypothetical protein
MSGGKQEWEITPAKVGFTPRDQEGSIGDNNNHNYGYIEDSKEKKIDGDPNKNSDKGWEHLQGRELTSALLKPQKSSHHINLKGRVREGTP